MGRIGLLFELRHAETRPGEIVSVVGSHPELGSWDCYTSSLQLRTGASCYPCWAMLAPAWIAPGSEDSLASMNNRLLSQEDTESQVSSPRAGRDPEVIPGEPEVVSSGASADSEPQFINIEYKYVKDRRQMKDCGLSIEWEDSIANRSVRLPFEPGSIWIISDTKFDYAREPPRVTRTTLVEILARRDELDLEFRRSTKESAPAPEWSGWEQEEEDRLSHHSGGTSFSHHTTSTVGILMLREP
eukprot:TRINITY_DN94478_c0_g1_i1.p1 TRINITY_DN94478_c0_g1~~TRINITY_DN94478_c0_g1_i1.p1  ORF type:complete len:243 (-),score=35.67 TRINITY_DN94478_c0_g1_i1:43-771(-)